MFKFEICKDPLCNRFSPHWVGEYGCVASDVWVCPPHEEVDQPCAARRFGHEHRRGCGCLGDPETNPLTPALNQRMRDSALDDMLRAMVGS